MPGIFIAENTEIQFKDRDYLLFEWLKECLTDELENKTAQLIILPVKICTKMKKFVSLCKKSIIKTSLYNHTRKYSL